MKQKRYLLVGPKLHYDLVMYLVVQLIRLTRIRGRRCEWIFLFSHFWEPRYICNSLLNIRTGPVRNKQ